MEIQEILSSIQVCSFEELSADEQKAVQLALEGTNRSYTPYSRFHVGAGVILNNGEEFIGCNQENAAFPAGLCAERTALYAAGAQYPQEPVKILAIAARGTDNELTEEPVSPCGTCRQVIIETETRFKQQVIILLYGKRCIYRVEGIRQLMPLSFTEF
jgi:cytidine deaminase